MIDTTCIQHIAEELELSPSQVTQAIELINGGAFIPFIAWYRKDVTGNLDELQLERIAERNTYFTGLLDRKRHLLSVLDEKGQLTDELRAFIEACMDNTVLEDIGLSYKKRRRSKATIAIEKGLEPLADYVWNQEANPGNIAEVAGTYVRPDASISSTEEAIEGACHILTERIAHDYRVRGRIRDEMLSKGVIGAHPTKNAEGKKTKFENYYDFSEPAGAMPSHRLLAILRGVKEGFLRMELIIDDAQMISEICRMLIVAPASPYEGHLRHSIESAYNQLLRPALENEVIALLRERAEHEAIRVFCLNARNILMAPPAGPITVIGVDTIDQGCVATVVDGDGALIEHLSVSCSDADPDAAKPEDALYELAHRHGAKAIVMGNSETARSMAVQARAALSRLDNKDAFCVFISEGSAAAYAGSPCAEAELPGLDASVRRAVSLARRLQDPLAELAKIEARHIGVGQYQQDVNKKKLRDGLHRTMASCINAVGVDVNKASSYMLGYVSGLHPSTASNVVAKREELGRIDSREQLREVDGIGPRVFEQCAGFVRVHGGAHPLDATRIHPDAYPVIERIAEATGVSTENLIGNAEALGKLDLTPFESGVIGPHTLAEIRTELLHPGRDPRPPFKAPRFLDGVHSVSDLEEGMVAEGVVTNVTDFGAFVDVGVGQDGLVHLSEMANRFVRDPRAIAKVGDVVRVKIIKVDKDQPRISLSMKALANDSHHRRIQRKTEATDGTGEATAKGSGPRQPSKEEARPSNGQPSRKSNERPRGQKTRTERSERRGKDRSKQKAKMPDAAAQHGDSGSINTQLADQLAALRDKLGQS